MEKIIKNMLLLAINWKDGPQNTTITSPSSHNLTQTTAIKLTNMAQGTQGSHRFLLNPWMIIACIIALHTCRQVFFFYRFFASEGIRPLWKYFSFMKHILPSFLLSLISNFRTINISFLTNNIDANAAIKKIHMLPCRSKHHAYYTDMHTYDSNFIIALDTDEKILAFRQVLMRFICERLRSGGLKQTLAEGVQKWTQKESVDMIDIIMLLENVILRTLYDIDPETTFTPEQRQKRAQSFYDGIKFVNYDSYRCMGSVYALLFTLTGRHFDPIRRRVVKELTEIWDDIYERQIEMSKKGQDCFLAAILQNPILAKQDIDFLKANVVGAIVGGQFLTSISNITGVLYNISKRQLPSPEEKINWILAIICDWSPIIRILRKYAGFVISIPSVGNSKELNRSFSLGHRQCPGRGMVLEVYGCVVDLLSRYRVSVEGLENTSIRNSLWPFANPQLRFRINQEIHL